jgi:dTDP-glucose pyrophosphorylase
MRLDLPALRDSNLVITASETITLAMHKLSKNSKRILFVVSERNELLGTLTDGDIRRALLHGASLDFSVEIAVHSQCLTAGPSHDTSAIERLLRIHLLDGIPVVDDGGNLLGAYLPDRQAVGDSTLTSHVPVLVMAGGRGERLMPLTLDTPKPLTRLHGTTPLDSLLRRLRLFGFRNVHIAVYHQHELVMKHVGDGSDFGLAITYLVEDRPLGTAGALGLMDANVKSSATLVLNSDIVFDSDLRSFVSQAINNAGETTVGLAKYEHLIPYGVAEIDEGFLLEVREKPKVNVQVLSGVTLVAPQTCCLIKNGESIDMSDLLIRATRSGQKVRALDLGCFWTDIGTHVSLRELDTNLAKLK